MMSGTMLTLHWPRSLLERRRDAFDDTVHVLTKHVCSKISLVGCVVVSEVASSPQLSRDESRVCQAVVSRAVTGACASQHILTPYNLLTRCRYRCIRLVDRQFLSEMGR